MNIDYPFHFDSRGQTATTSDDDHIRDLIEQVLFTSPGERVNRPDFGCGLRQLVFAPNSEELAAATQFLVQGSLQQWLGNLIKVEAVEVSFREVLKKRSFLLLNLIEGIRMMAVSTVAVHVMPYLGSIGISRSRAGLPAPT
jgi:phage baseplate assembly protein W